MCFLTTIIVPQYSLPKPHRNIQCGIHGLISLNAAFSQALELLFMNPDLSNPDVFSFSAAISACEKVGNWQRALHLLYFMSSRRVPG